jgi:hypothetical protein
MAMSSTRLSEILERLRSDRFPDLKADLVRQVAEVEERNVFDDDRRGALKELRNLIAIEIQAARVGDAE